MSFAERFDNCTGRSDGNLYYGEEGFLKGGIYSQAFPEAEYAISFPPRHYPPFGEINYNELDEGKQYAYDHLFESYKELDVRRFDMSRYGMDYIPAMWFKHLPNLRIVILNKNRIQEFPEELTKLKYLISVNLQDNDIEKLPVQILSNSRYKQIYLHNNKRLGSLQTILNAVTKPRIRNYLVDKYEIDRNKFQTPIDQWNQIELHTKYLTGDDIPKKVIYPKLEDK